MRVDRREPEDQAVQALTLGVVALVACGGQDRPQHAREPAPITAVSTAPAPRAPVLVPPAPVPRLRVDIHVPYPVQCPTIGSPKGDPKRIAPTDAFAALAVDIDRFLRVDYGIPEAVALFGPPALCDQAPASGYLSLHLAPLAANLHAVELETHDGELEGFVIEFRPPLAIDLTPLSKRHGPLQVLGSYHGPRRYAIDTETADYRGQLMFTCPRDDQVSELIFRRTSMIEILPDKFLTGPDLVRLARLALRPRAPEYFDLLDARFTRR